MLDLFQGELGFHQFVKRLRAGGNQVLANKLEWFELEYRKRADKPTGPKTRWRPKRYERADWLLLCEAEQRARSAPNGKTAFELIRETVVEASVVGIPGLRGDVLHGLGYPHQIAQLVKPCGASNDAIVRRLFALLRPRKADSRLPFEFPGLEARVTPYKKTISRRS